MTDSSPYSYQSISTAITRRRPLHSPRSSSPTATATADVTDPSSCNNNNISNSQRPQPQRRLLRRSLRLPDLIFYGVGCSVGAGIYSLVGLGATIAGPGIAVSFALCGMACCCTSLAYAEFAARIPSAGSAYTFVYVSFGELCGWLVGWNLTLGYAVSASVVARSWADYVVGLCQGLLWRSDGTTTTMTTLSAVLHWSIHAPLPVFHNDDGDVEALECCPLAMVIILFCTLVLVSGAKESSRFNTAMTILNLSVLSFVVLAGLASGTALQIDNLTPVLPHGWHGVGRAAGLVFFSYLGFDMVSCLSEEVENPERNMPIGIIGSLVTSMTIYCCVSLVVVGMAPTALLGEDVPIVNALLANACCTHEQQLATVAADDDASAVNACLTYACAPVLRPALYVGSRIVSCGAVFGLTTACFACLMGQPRIFFSMAQDGLLFKIYAKVDPRSGVPIVGTILTGVLTAVIACFIDLESLANSISLGTLQVFTFVNAGVIILRMTPPTGTTLTAMTGRDDVAAVREGREWDPDNGRDDVHRDERSPLLPDEGGAVLLKHYSSREVRVELQKLGSSHVVDGNNGPINSLEMETQARLSRNKSWPHWLTLCFTICAVCLSAILSQINDSERGAGFMTLVAALASLLFVSAVLLCRLPQSPPPDTFTCPLVPVVPLLGILCNSYMMGSLPLSTWSAVSVWLLAGVCFYFAYGMHHSELRGMAATLAVSKNTEPAKRRNCSGTAQCKRQHLLLLPGMILLAPISSLQIATLPTVPPSSPPSLSLAKIQPKRISALASSKKSSYDSSSMASASIEDSRRVQTIIQNRQTRGNPALLTEEGFIAEKTRIGTSSLKTAASRKSNTGALQRARKRPAIIKSTQVPKSANATKVSLSKLMRPSNGLHFPYDITLQALKRYHDNHGHLVLPRRFSVPESTDYPSMWHGVDLAGTVYNMRWWLYHVKQQPDRVHDLNRLGFVWERLQPEWNLILEALIVYRGLHGDLLVPSDFTVPHESQQWPKACWGIALGSAVFKIRNRSDHLRDANTSWKRREQLDRIGFVWDVQELRFNKFCRALKVYRKVEERTGPADRVIALKIPSKFVVPRSSQWPNEFWGYRLGERCTQVRQKQLYVRGHPERLKVMADLGFYVSGGNDCLKWLEVVHAAAVYSQMHGNALDVPTKFVVPAPPKKVHQSIETVEDSCVIGSDEAWPWPEYLWGFPLGQRLRDIRVKGYYLRGKQSDVRRRQLDALGFVWKPQRGRRRNED